MSQSDELGAKLRFSAMNSLSRREHSRLELEKKLAAKYPFADEQLVNAVLDRLADQDLQSDERFSESFCRSRLAKGQGRLRIVNELRLRGISEAQASRILDTMAIDWYELAKQVAERRFGEGPAEDIKDKSRRARFLQYRGFDHDQIRYALKG